jgi:radical SAM protein with 4Fe4S-binding SPASM domain
MNWIKRVIRKMIAWYVDPLVSDIRSQQENETKDLRYLIKSNSSELSQLRELIDNEERLIRDISEREREYLMGQLTTGLDEQNEQVKRAWKRMDEQNGWIDEHTARLDEQNRWIDEHTARLDEQQGWINDHMGYIHQNSLRIDQNAALIVNVEDRVGFTPSDLNPEELVVKINDVASDEDEYYRKMGSAITNSISYMNRLVQSYYRNIPLFSYIEIETFNRCNGRCEFCRVNVRNDPRDPIKMDTRLFEKIIGELKELGYKGRFSFYSNNEPLLDDRIYDFIQYAREQLPHCHLRINTNGTLLEMDKFLRLEKLLDEIVIDNYTEDLELMPISREIKHYCEEHPWLIRKVTINCVSPKAVRSSRGSSAPNRNRIGDYVNCTCLCPFTQLIIRPDGKLSLCCSDALGKFTMGDLNDQTILEAWYGKEYQLIRDLIYKGRNNIDICEHCDVFR